MVVPRFLGMASFVDEEEPGGGAYEMRERRRSSFGLMQRAEEYVLKQPRSEMMFDKQRERHGLMRSIGNTNLNIPLPKALYIRITTEADMWSVGMKWKLR